MTWRSLTELWWRLTFQQTICVLGNLRDLLSFCDLSIHFLTALSFIFPMQVLYCVTLSLEAIHCVDIDLFFLTFLLDITTKLYFWYSLHCRGHGKMCVSVVLHLRGHIWCFESCCFWVFLLVDFSEKQDVENAEYSSLQHLAKITWERAMNLVTVSSTSQKQKEVREWQATTMVENPGYILSLSLCQNRYVLLCH